MARIAHLRGWPQAWVSEMSHSATVLRGNDYLVAPSTRTGSHPPEAVARELGAVEDDMGRGK